MNKLRMALEAINFQSTDFADAITKNFEIILNYNDDKEAANSQEVKNIVELTKQRTGINVKLVMDDSKHGAVGIPLTNYSHIFMDPLFRSVVSNDANRLLAEMKKFKSESFVDLKNARVGGFFSAYVWSIWLSWKTNKKMKLSAREVTAIYLHELGHIFTMFEFTTRAVLTNQALAYYARSLGKDKSAGDKQIVVLKELGEVVTDDKDYFIDLAGVTNSTVINTMLISRTIHDVRNNMNSGDYSETSCEAQADAFAARFGYGRELVSASVKINKFYGIDIYNSYGRALSFAIDFYSLVLIPTLIVFFTASVGSAAAYIFLLLVTLFGKSTMVKDFGYDDAKVRFARIKEQIVDNLKNPLISEDSKKRDIAAIKDIEDQMKQIRDVKSYTNLIADFIIPGSRKMRKAIELERELEVLAANDIYTKAAELSLMK